MDFDLLGKLLETYKKPQEPMIRQMERVIKSIPERCREDVFNRVLEDHSAGFQIDVKAIIDTCKNMGVPYTQSFSHYLNAEDWTCDACGFEFKYHPAPTDDDYIDKRIYDFCPRCGFQPCWTKQKIGYGPAWTANAEEIYQRHVATAIEKLKQRKKDYWCWHDAERERAKELTASANRKLAEIDRAKR